MRQTAAANPPWMMVMDRVCCFRPTRARDSRERAHHLPAHLVNRLMRLAALGQEGAVQVEDETHRHQQQRPDERSVPRGWEGGYAAHHRQARQVRVRRMRDLLVHRPKHRHASQVVDKPHQHTQPQLALRKDCNARRCFGKRSASY
jgi:hypothetical protein